MNAAQRVASQAATAQENLMKRKPHPIFAFAVAFLAAACWRSPALHAMPRFMDRYDADAYAKPELKGRCTVCHKNEDGFGLLNKTGQAFAQTNYRITEELRRQAPEAFNATPNAAPKPAFDAKAFYAKSCAVCHGADGKGGASSAMVPNFSDAAWQRRHDEAKLVAAIANGKGTMPAFKERLSEEQIKALVALLRTFPDQK